MSWPSRSPSTPRGRPDLARLLASWSRPRPASPPSPTSRGLRFASAQRIKLPQWQPAALVPSGGPSVRPGTGKKPVGSGPRSPQWDPRWSRGVVLEQASLEEGRVSSIEVGFRFGPRAPWSVPGKKDSGPRSLEPPRTRAGGEPCGPTPHPNSPECQRLRRDRLELQPSSKGVSGLRGSLGHHPLPRCPCSPLRDLRVGGRYPRAPGEGGERATRGRRTRDPCRTPTCLAAGPQVLSPDR